MAKAKIFVLGLCAYFCFPVFRRLALLWFPDEFGGEAGADLLRRAAILAHKFWRAAALVVGAIAITLLLQWWRRGNLSLATADWLRIAAAFIAITATLGRGGWGIQTWNAKTIVERIDRGMYVIGQLGAVCLLIFILSA